METKLFELVHSIGEVLIGDLHVLDMSDYVCYEDDRKYRVYHSKGYCFDIERLTVADEQTDEAIGFEYFVYDEWDGFEKLDTEGYIKLIEEWKQ